VISDGIIGLDEAIQADEAPRLQEAKPFGDGRIDRGEEGTAMIEIVHDLAPGAEISFGAVYTDLDHIAAVNYFAQRVDIIVDDVSFAYPANQRSDVSINTTSALRHPDWPIRLYVTAAGNWAESHWSGTWQAGPDGTQVGLSSPGAVHQFNQTGDAGLFFGAGNGFNVEQDDEVRLALFWDDPWGRSTNDYNLYLVSGVGEVLASSVITQGVGVGQDQPREHLTYTHTGEATVLFAVIQNHNNDASPVNFDLFVFQTGRRQLRLSHQSPEGSLLAQSDAADALTVGAVNAGRQVVAEYSSRGPTVNGIAKPEISAVDRVSVSPSTIFGPHFSGSSAAAPHVAGIAALLLEAHSALLAADGGSPLLERRLIRDILTDT
ncbi:MAG: S8 family serine peptidase, partial [Chloroflexi bacterium]|nr:S8 family serine peptidase [Chloroflexota bacterium]